MSAEEATGFGWGDQRLVREVRQLLREAEESEDDRTVTLAERFLRMAEPQS